MVGLLRQFLFGTVIVLQLIGVAIAQTQVSFSSGGLRETGTIATVNKPTGRLAATYYIVNVSTKSLRMFIGERATAADNVGNSWEAYNVNNAVGIWACMNNVNNECLRHKLDEVEQNATILNPGETINMVVTLVLKGSRLEKVGDGVSIGLVAHVQELRGDGGGGAGPWHTVQIGLPNIPLNSR